MLEGISRVSSCHLGPIQAHRHLSRIYASVSAYMRDVLHWLPVSQRILYMISALVWRSVAGCAPSYLTDLCRPVSDLASRRALRSSAHGELLVPRARLSSVEISLLLAPPLGMNSLLHSACYLRITCLLSAIFLKTFVFDRRWTESASE